MATSRTPSKTAAARSTAQPKATPAAKRSSKPAATPAVNKTASKAGAAAAPQGAAQPATTRITSVVPDQKAKKPAKNKVAKADHKVKKPKLVRDSFTIPKAEYEVIEVLKLRAGKLAKSPKKSELLRAGLKALAAMGDAEFLSSLAAVPPIKTGRPAA